ncbi:MAG: amidase [Solirubrobacteraceae bacterium]|nr:amidase [Solirubrobacteraceae bacterium]
MSLNRKLTGLAVAATLVGSAVSVLPAGATGRATAASSATVTLKNIKFHAAKVTIARGGTVHWVWHDGSTPHNVTGPGFHSRTITRGSFSHRFTHSGTFHYRCTIHPGMNGTVVVH